MNTDSDWELWGKLDPYYGVVTHDKFRMKNLTERARGEFFDSGKAHIDHVLEILRSHFDRSFSPASALDFGCGTGRLVIPLAKIASHVVGLDISESMLDEARKNCDKYSVKNVRLLKSDDTLSSVDEKFDFIHSFIVFQHIPVARGCGILANLLNRLKEGGMGVLHFTYSKAGYAGNLGLPGTGEFWIGKLKQSLRASLKKMLRFVLPKDPEMQMNKYNANQLLFLFQTVGANNVFIEFTDHDGELGIICYFQKSKLV